MKSSVEAQGLRRAHMKQFAWDHTFQLAVLDIPPKMKMPKSGPETDPLNAHDI